MDINARIDWRNGLELTAQTFIALDKNIDWRHKVISKITNDNLVGLLPFTVFDCKAIFVKRNLEIERLECIALLPTGDVLHIDERIEVQIPMLYGNCYYLACSISDKKENFNSEGVPYTRPKYEYTINTLDEIEDKILFPILKFNVKDGLFSIDEEYIPPTLLLSSFNKFSELKEKIVTLLKAVAEHQNMEEGDAQRSLLRYIFILESYGVDNKVRNFMEITLEIAQCIDYYIVKGNGQKEVEFPHFTQYDPLIWLNFIIEYLNGAITILDKVVLEDKTIDLERLKAELRAELYEQIYGELYNKLYSELKQSISSDLYNEIREKLVIYINGEFRKDLYDALENELRQELSESLFTELYEKLYNALYVSTESEESDYIPLI